MDSKFNIDPKLIEELAKSVKTEKDLAALSKHLLKMTVERAMNVEMDEHLGYEKHAPAGKHTGNSRNGYTPKKLKGNFGEMPIETPRDRHNAFEPQLIRKGQTRITEFDGKILSLYAKGMTTRDIAEAFKEMYGADVSHSLISRVTDAVIDEVNAWQTRPLDEVYPVLYLDCIVVKCHQDKRVINKAVFIALAVNKEGHILALCADGIKSARGKRYFNCLCRWLNRFSRGNQCGLPQDPYSALYSPSCPQFITLCVLQGYESHCRRFKNDLSIC